MISLPAASVCVTCSTKFASEQQILNFYHANLQNASYTYKLPKLTTSYKISNINQMLVNFSLSVLYTSTPLYVFMTGYTVKFTFLLLSQE